MHPEKCRVDKIDNMGIVQSETFQRTHHLRMIKRLLPDHTIDLFIEK